LKSKKIPPSYPKISQGKDAKKITSLNKEKRQTKPRDDWCPLMCKASLGTTQGYKLGSTTTVTLEGVPLHFRLG
jgi:hypothetical protein